MTREDRIIELKQMLKHFIWLTNEDEREAYPVDQILNQFITEEIASTPII